MRMLFFLFMLLFSTLAEAQRLDTFLIFEKGKAPFSTPKKAVEKVMREEADSSILLVNGIAEPRIVAFFPEKSTANGLAVVICPGGAYSVEAFDHEGFQVAERLAGWGFAAFVLFYRLPDDSTMTEKSVVPLLDAQQALRFVRQNGEKWTGRPFEKVGIMGFSAGGHLAATASAPPPDMAARFGELGQKAARPDFSALIYPVISMEKGVGHDWSREQLLGKKPSARTVAFFSPDRQVASKTPPAFLVHSADDAAVPVENALRYARALQKRGVPFALHVFSTGGHGYGLGKKGAEAAVWPELFRAWATGL